jgi:hypothetical protein
MPIRPENKPRYPATWPALVAAAQARSGNRCECTGQCGLAHPGGRCAAVHRGKHPDTGNMVILTLAHFTGVPLESVDIGQMFYACQRCHNRYDGPARRAGIRARRYKDQLDLFAQETTP